MSATMRVSELIGRLATFDPDLLVEVCSPSEVPRYAPVLVICPVTAGNDAKRFQSGEQVLEHYIQGYKRPQRKKEDYS